MSEAKLSPGPWRYTATGYIVDAKDRPIADFLGLHPDLEADEADANARVMVYAPELLAMLELWVTGDGREYGVMTSDGIRAAVVLIAKAKGERETKP